MGILLMLCRNSGSVLDNLLGTAPKLELSGVWDELFRMGILHLSDTEPGLEMTLVGTDVKIVAFLLWGLGGFLGGADLITLLGRGGAPGCGTATLRSLAAP